MPVPPLRPDLRELLKSIKESAVYILVHNDSDDVHGAARNIDDDVRKLEAALSADPQETTIRLRNVQTGNVTLMLADDELHAARYFVSEGVYEAEIVSAPDTKE